MTNQNNELDRAIKLMERAVTLRSPALREVEMTRAKQAIQALYAPEPVENGELREQVLTEFKQVHKLAPADYTENCTNIVMSLVEAYITANYTPNSEVEQLKSRIAWLEGKIEGLSNDNLTPHLTPHLTPKKLPRFEP